MVLETFEPRGVPHGPATFNILQTENIYNFVNFISILMIKMCVNSCFLPSFLPNVSFVYMFATIV